MTMIIIIVASAILSMSVLLLVIMIYNAIRITMNIYTVTVEIIMRAMPL